MTNLIIGLMLGFIVSDIVSRKKVETKLEENKAQYDEAINNLKGYYEAKAERASDTETPKAKARIGFNTSSMRETA